MCCTVCRGSNDPLYIVTYYIKWVSTSWADSMSGVLTTLSNLSNFEHIRLQNINKKAIKHLSH